MFIIANRMSGAERMRCDFPDRARCTAERLLMVLPMDSCPFLKSGNFVEALVEPSPKYHSPKVAATSCDESVAAIGLVRIPVNELRSRQAAKYASPRC